MRDNTRRNRNIGTAKQGHGQNNRLRIPSPYLYRDDRFFTERLVNYEKSLHAVNGYEFTFVVESLRADCYYPCTREDVAFLLAHIPVTDFGELRLIIFRQPKRKEEILSPVWARLKYEYKFENRYQPAVVLEAFKMTDCLKWPRCLTVDDSREFERLKKDGHEFIPDKRGYRAPLTPENARATQLYRSLPHEFGHYAHYWQVVEQPESFDTTKEERYRFYMNSISQSEKEKFAHAYADRLQTALREEGIIPFQRKEPDEHTVLSG